jgi:hypothetical protein
MIAAMKLLPNPLRRATRGFSDSAQFVDEQSEEWRKHLQPFFSYGRRTELLSEIYDVAEELSRPGWNGGDEAPLRQESFYRAYCLAEALPSEIPNPTVGADPDGELTFEWYRGPRRLLSLSIAGEGFIHYVARIGPNELHGVEEFFDEMPRRIVELVQDVVTA